MCKLNEYIERGIELTWETAPMFEKMSLNFSSDNLTVYIYGVTGIPGDPGRAVEDQLEPSG